MNAKHYITCLCWEERVVSALAYMLTHRCKPETGSEWFKPILTSDSKHKDQQNLLLIITRCDHYEKKGKLRANAMKCVAAGRPSLDSLAFEPMKRPDDRADYCLIMTFLVIFLFVHLTKDEGQGDCALPSLLHWFGPTCMVYPLAPLPIFS